MAAYAQGAVIITIDADGKLAIKELEDTEDKLGGVGQKSDETNKRMAALTAGTTVLAASLVAVGAAALQMSMNFDAAFAKTRTIIDDTQMSASAMRAEILALSTDSAMAATDVSEAVYQAISGSVATADAAAFVDQANRLAVAGFTSLTGATDILTTTLNAYRLGAESVTGISNVLIQTQNLGKTSVDELSASMGRAISTGSAYGVNLENLSTAYVELTRGGIATAEATTYLSGMLNELGDTGSKVGEILQEQTGKTFGQLMADGWSLADVLKIVQDSVNGNAEAMMGLWSSQEAGKAANAIVTQGLEDFNAVLAQMEREMSGTTDTTEKAYETMTNTSEFIDKRFSNSVTNLGIAFGDGLRPSVDGVKSLLTGLVEGLTSLIQKSPWISAIFAGLTAGVGAMAIALTLYTLKTKLATSETLKLTAAMATNPVVLAIGAVSLLAVTLGTLAAQDIEATESTERLSAASQEQADKIAELNEQYDKICQTMGESSAEAQLLKKRIDDETASFERNKQTAAELTEELKNTHDAYNEMVAQHQEAIEGIESEYDNTLNLIFRLQELTAAEEATAQSKEEILAIVDLLNERIPELALNYDSLTGRLSMTPEQVQKLARDEAERRKNEEIYQALIDAEQADGELYAKKEAAKENRDAAVQRYKKADAAYKSAQAQQKQSGLYATTSEEAIRRHQEIEPYWAEWRDAKQALSEADAALETAEADYEANQTKLKTLSEELVTYREETETASEAQAKMAEFTAGLAEDLEKLCTAYSEAYEAAYQSITGQYTIWDGAAPVIAKSVSSINASILEQTEYWKNYNENIQNLSARNIEGLNEMIASFADGSPDAVNAIAGMANATDEELTEMVKNWQTLKEQQEMTSGSLADLETDFADSMNAIKKQAKETISEMTLDEEAANSGRDTIQGYIDGANDMLPAVTAAYAAVGQAAIDAIDQKLEIHSPSRVMMEKARMTWAGYIEETNALRQSVAEATAQTANGIISAVSDRIPGTTSDVLSAEQIQAALQAVYPTAPQMAYIGAGSPAVAKHSTVQIRAVISVPLEIDGREVARATAEYNGEEMEFEVMGW